MIDETANIQTAVSSILLSKTCEQSSGQGSCVRAVQWAGRHSCLPASLARELLAASAPRPLPAPASLAPPPAVDNGVICASEQSVVVVDEVRARLPRRPPQLWHAAAAALRLPPTPPLLWARRLPRGGGAAAATTTAAPAAACLWQHCRWAGMLNQSINQSLLLQVYEQVKAEFIRRGAYFLTEEEKGKVGWPGRIPVDGRSLAPPCSTP